MAASADQQHMQAAIELSERAGIAEKTGRCFGAVVVKDGNVIGEGYNQVKCGCKGSPAGLCDLQIVIKPDTNQPRGWGFGLCAMVGNINM
jgi:deoxycytidylate deaminase